MIQEKKITIKKIFNKKTKTWKKYITIIDANNDSYNIYEDRLNWISLSENSNYFIK